MKGGEKPIRRTKMELDSRLLIAAKEVVREVGFNNVTIAKLLEKADVLPSVFYNRYGDLNDLFEKIVREYDYFFNDTMKFDPLSAEPVQLYENLLKSLVDSLENNRVMQELLIWEISSDNYITKRTANSRELHGKDLLDFFNYEFRNTSIDVNALTAMIIGGIYYLILHRDISTFCGIDFSKKEGILRMKKTIHTIIKNVYADSNVDANAYGITKEDEDISEFQMIRFAKTLLKNGVDKKIVKKTTGLSDKVLSELISPRGRKKDITNISKESASNLPSTTPRKRGRPRKTAPPE